MFPVCLLLFALQEPSPSPSVAPQPETKAAGAPQSAPTPRATRGNRKFVKGTLGGLDLEQRTVRFTDLEGRVHIWPVDARLAEAAAPRAADLAKALKPGDPIEVAYHEDDGKPTITAIAKRHSEGEPGERRENEGNQ